jgi:broad specificity phosphatase PhoE
MARAYSPARSRAHYPFDMKGTVHLVRHGEVENPAGIIYGRLPGYHLSERGRRQARGAAERLEDLDIGAVWASPMERAQETAQPIAESHGLEIVTDERLNESLTKVEGVGSNWLSFLASPKHWWSFRNPLKPSWGESFNDIRDRMLSAIDDALAGAAGRELVIVSHQTPVLVARLWLTNRRVPPWLALSSCVTGSVSTLVLKDGKVASSSYFAPVD